MKNDNFFSDVKFWFGEVESNSDPLGLGRVKTRIIGWHNRNTSELPTEALPYCYVTNSLNPSKSGIGRTSVGLIPGTRVFGAFIEEDIPIIFGSIPSLSSEYITQIVENGGTTHSNSIFSRLLGHVDFQKEGDCPSGDAGDISTDDFPEESEIEINYSEWVYPTTGYICSKYGSRAGRHRGVDICPAGFFKQTDSGANHLNNRLVGSVGIPVFSVADGEVIYKWNLNIGQGGIKSEYDKKGPYNSNPRERSYGNALAIKHLTSTGTFITIYAHLGENQNPLLDNKNSGILVNVGDTVKKGQQIGTIGRTHVWDSLTHLHFEVRIGSSLPKSNNHINPSIIFPKMNNKHWNIEKWVIAQNSFNVEPIFKNSDAPIIANQEPLRV